MGTSRKFVQLFAVLILFVLLSTTGYIMIEGWSFLDSLYMTIMTVATVGYGEVHPLSETGKYYTILVILVGVGVAGFTLSNLTAFFVSGHVRNLLKAGKMQQRIAKLKDHYIVCGCGKMGYEAVRELKAEGKELVAIDLDSAKTQRLEREGTLYILGDSTQDEILKQAGVERARGLLATLPTDADNVYVSLSARGLNSSLFVIARGSDENSESKLLKAGANRVILPYHIGGRRMASILVKPEIVDFLDVMMGKDQLSLRMEIVRVEEKSKLPGFTLQSSNIRRDSGGVLVMGLIRKNGEMLPNPSKDTEIRAGDQLIVLGRTEQIQQMEQLAS
ncbi:MAG: potassium channel protein [bacterium]|nr:potassium channel protein [bacterium]